MLSALEPSNDIPPMVSVIIPVYCVEKLIARCLDSVIVQTWTHLEIIVVNDATTDCSMEIVASYAKRDSRIKVIENDRNQGVMVARNIGCEQAIGKYLMFLDSDDFLPPRAVELMVCAAEEKGADLVCGQRDRVRDDGTHDSRTNYHCQFGLGIEGLYRAMLQMSFPDTVWGKLYSRSLFDPPCVVFENQNEGEDTMLSFILTPRVKNAVFIEDVVYHYYENALSTTNRKTLANIESRMRAVKFVKQIVSEFPSLRNDLAMWAAIVLHLYYRHGSRDKVAVHELLIKHGLAQYVQVGWLFKNLSVAEFRYVMKRCLCISLIKWCPNVVLGMLRRLFRS